MKKEDICTVKISLEIESEISLFIVLGNEGSISRRGNSGEAEMDTNLYIGITEPSIFQEFMEEFSEDLFAHAGSYEFPDRQGESCHLVLDFTDTNGQTQGFEFLYGTQSDFPPYDIIHLVKEAVRLTDPWYQSQQKIKMELANKPPQSDS